MRRKAHIGLGRATHKRQATDGRAPRSPRGLAGQRAGAPPHTAPQAPPVWRAPEGPEGQGGLRDRPLRATGSRVAISRAAGPDGAQNTSDATTNQATGSRVAISRAAGSDGARNTSGQQATRSRPAPQGPGGSRVRPLGGSQRLFQRIWVPSEPRRWQASTTRAAMPASADLPHVRGSYCFLTPTSPSILRTPS